MSDAGSSSAESKNEEDDYSEDDISSGASGMAQLAMPKGSYRLPNHPASAFAPTSATTAQEDGEVQRLLLLAKHPNATPDEIAKAVASSQASQARRREKQLEQQRSTATFSPAFPVDTDTGEAWEEQQKRLRWQQHRQKTWMEDQVRKQQEQMVY